MTPVSIGVIANPASGKDIRRLVAHASTFDNNEKINIVRRTVLAAVATGVEQIWYMPDLYGIVARAINPLRLEVPCDPLPMTVLGNASDSLEAARRMHDLDAGCIIVLGGDGTNRIVAFGCGDTPLVSISTGTNNVFPLMLEGTIAGFAAGLIASGLADAAITRAPRLDVYVDGKLLDAALIDVATTAHRALGARALWDVNALREVVLSRITASVIGICSLGGLLYPAEIDSGCGAYIRLGEPAQRTVLAAIGPGLIMPVSIASSHLLHPGQRLDLTIPALTVALDGEREIELRGGETISVELNLAGPRVVDVARAIRLGVESGAFDINSPRG